MSKLRVVVLILLSVAASFIVAHIMYVNRLVGPGTSIQIFQNFHLRDDAKDKNKKNDAELVHDHKPENGLGNDINGSKNDKKGPATATESKETKASKTGKGNRDNMEGNQVLSTTANIKESPKGHIGKRTKKGTFKEWYRSGSKGETQEQETGLKPCTKGGRALVGLMYIDQTVPDMEKLEKQMSVAHGGTVESGGWWKPSDCKPLAKTAIIIPYRNREQQLKVFLRHLHPILQRQLLYYRIIVVEQDGDTPFNRAGLFNVGFKEALKLDDFNCFVFTDVDLLPEDDRNNYGCPTSPRHMSVAVDKFNYQLPYATIFGGVGAFKRDHFEAINGFSNRFWGWGGEDDDLYNRIIAKGFQLTRPSLKIGRYTMIKIYHFQSHGADPNRLNLLQNSRERMTSDGLNTLQYQVKETKVLPLVTMVTVNIERT